MALLLAGGATGFGSTQGAEPRLQALTQPGKWPVWPRGDARDVTVVGNYAYLGLSPNGLAVFDVRNPNNCRHVNELERTLAVDLRGNYAYAVGWDGLEVLNVSNPTNHSRLGGYALGGVPTDVAVVADRVYVTLGPQGLVILPSVPNVQFALRIEATPGASFTLETARDLSDSTPWTTLVTTNSSTNPFDFVDFDVRLPEHPKKYYRVLQHWP